MANIRMIVAGVESDLCSILKSGLQTKPEIELILSVRKPSEAENKLTRMGLNVLLIDLDTTQADTLSVEAFSKRYSLLTLYTARSNAGAMALLKNSAKDFILKPPTFTPLTASNYVTMLYRRIEGFRNQQIPPSFKDMSKLADGVNKKVIAIASSTGGTDALEKILRQLPDNAPPIVVVQHMPSGFTKLFADRLNAVYKLNIKEAKSGDYLKQGQMLLAPADFHIRLVRQQGSLAVECFIGVKLHGVMPAADILFESVAELVKSNAIGVILTGMGADGARGLMKMHNAGAKTIGQSKESCVVYGMPKVAKDLGAVDFELPIEKIAEKIMSLV